MHMTSDVQGKLRKDKTPFDALASVLPAGTLSGAPKVRAMEIIDELETKRRGLYGGAIGYIGFDGNFDSCITIRTGVFQNNTCYVGAGGGLYMIPTQKQSIRSPSTKRLLCSVQ